jgi:hypothetical protein
MTIDLNAKEPLMAFRKCFDEIIFPPSLVPENEVSELISQSPQKRKKLKEKE